MQRILQNRFDRVLLLVLLCTSVLVAGCTSMPGQQQDVPAKTYLLQTPQNGFEKQVTATAPSLTLVVNSMRAASGFASSRIAYVKKDYQLDYFARHRWADTPANMLTTIFTHALERCHVLSAVAESPAAIKTDLRLDSELLRLQQVFKDGGSNVELELHVMLIDNDSRAVVASQTFFYTETAPEDTPYGGVVAANRAVERLLPELVGFVSKATHDHAVDCQDKWHGNK